MYDLSNIPPHELILAMGYLFLEQFWPWITGVVFVLVLWRIKIPVKKKLHVAGIVTGLFIVGKMIYHFFPGFIPGCSENSTKGVYKMPDYTIINQKGGKYFFPYCVSPKEPIRYIFPVPVNDAVATIDFDNAITIIKFRGDTTPDYDIVAKDFLSEVVGDFNFGFCPVFDEEIIVYTQTRWAVVANIRTGKVESPILTMSLDDMIGGIFSLDTSKNLFVINKLIPAREGSRQMLNVMRYNQNKFFGLGEIDAGGDFPLKQPWIVHDRKIITYDSAANKLLCHDSNLKPSTHPFVEIFNRNNGKFRKLKEMIIHPTLPFGLVVEIGKDLDWAKINAMPLNDETDKIKRALYKQQEIHALYLLRWDTPDTNKQYIPLHTDTLSLIAPFAAKQYGRFTFSPDGKWLILGHEDMRKDNRGILYGGELRPFFVAFPVDEKKPFFFGEPIFMGRTLIKENYLTTTAWTTEPTAFVAADGLALYKWDLGNLDVARTITTPDTLFPLE
jgi:hypothetical protein